MKMKNIKSILALLAIMLFGIANGQHHGSKEDREALFDYIIEKTKDREAFSPVKEKIMGFDPIEEMMNIKDEVVNASSDVELFYALQKLSAARRDRHLSVEEIEGGLLLPAIDKQVAPIRFHPDFSDPDKYTLFVSNLGEDIKLYTSNFTKPELGDVLVKVNGQAIQDYIDEASLYTRHSSINNLWMRLAYSLSEKSNDLPPSFYKDELILTLQRKGREYDLALPYLPEVSWQRGRVDRNYPGYKKVDSFDFDSFALYIPNKKDHKSLVLWWYGFRGDLPDATDALIAYAKENDMLDYDLIIDAIDSRGGSQGAYALARLASHPFKTTGGNLKLSDITNEFIAKYTQQYLSKKAIMDGDGRETEDDGTWAIEWLHGPVLQGLAAGQEYSNNTPFKCAHLPHYSDWIMKPAETHFTGKIVTFFGPWGGSHLTQFASMIIDNELGYSIGMADGGYSNTWEWEEDLVFPISREPVVSFMWSIGHTIRPNGQIAEGNPPMVEEYVPVSRENYFEYKSLLLERAHSWLAQ